MTATAVKIYKNKNERDLRLLDARKWLGKIEKEGKPDFMTLECERVEEFDGILCCLFWKKLGQIMLF